MAGIENRKYIRKMNELRRSNASGIHEDRRTKRKRSRSDSKKAAIRFSKDGRFRLLEVV